MRWLSSLGGPLVLLPESVAKLWRGVDGCEGQFDLANGKSDYDRACETSGYLGVIPVGGHDAVVFAEPMATTWIPAVGVTCGMFVQWVYAEDQAAVAALLKRGVPNALFVGTALDFCASDSRFLLIDAGIPGKEANVGAVMADVTVGEALAIELSPAKYLIETATFNPDNRTCIVVHRLVARSTS